MFWNVRICKNISINFSKSPFKTFVITFFSYIHIFPLQPNIFFLQNHPFPSFHVCKNILYLYKKKNLHKITTSAIQVGVVKALADATVNYASFFKCSLRIPPPPARNGEFLKKTKLVIKYKYFFPFQYFKKIFW